MTEPQGEYTIGWFKEVKAMHPEYLGAQAYELLGLYEELEAENERLAETINSWIEDGESVPTSRVSVPVGVLRLWRDALKATANELTDE